jgi:hypothetical protein
MRLMRREERLGLPSATLPAQGVGEGESRGTTSSALQGKPRKFFSQNEIRRRYGAFRGTNYDVEVRRDVTSHHELRQLDVGPHIWLRPIDAVLLLSQEI